MPVPALRAALLLGLLLSFRCQPVCCSIAERCRDGRFRTQIGIFETMASKAAEISEAAAEAVDQVADRLQDMSASTSGSE